MINIIDKMFSIFTEVFKSKNKAQQTYTQCFEANVLPLQNKMPLPNSSTFKNRVHEVWATMEYIPYFFYTLLNLVLPPLSYFFKQ